MTSSNTQYAELIERLRRANYDPSLFRAAATALERLSSDREMMREALEKLVELDSDGEAGCCVDPIEYGEALNRARSHLMEKGE